MATPVTLYIDESGQFEAEDGTALGQPWILGGFISEIDRHTVERDLWNAIHGFVDNVTKEPWFERVSALARKHQSKHSNLTKAKRDLLGSLLALPSDHGQLHRTALATALKLIDDKLLVRVMPDLDSRLFGCLAKLRPKPEVFGIIHSAPFCSHEASNYAMLVQELINQVCGGLDRIIGENEEVKLKCVIARRRQSHQEFAHQLFRNQLSIAVANGLSSAGSLRFLSDDSVEIVRAEESAALLVCDFICGHIAHVVRKNKGFETSRRVLKGEGILLSEFSDSYVSKRKAVAESKGEYVEAILCTLETLEVGSDLERLLTSIFEKDEMRARYDWESLINKLDSWAALIGKEEFVNALMRLNHALEQIQETSAPPAVKAAKFRLLAYTVAWTNHLGHSAESERILDLLSANRQEAKSDPHLYEAVLQAEIGRIEQAINDHRFCDAVQLANDHKNRVQSRLAEQNGKQAPCHALIRAECIDLRCSALSAAQSDDAETLEVVLCSVNEEVAKLETTDNSLNDDYIIRLLQVRAFVAEVLTNTAELAGVINSVLEVCSRTDSLYAVALLGRASASASLLGQRANTGVRDILAKAALAAIPHGIRHPAEIILRETLILDNNSHFLSSDQKKKTLDAVDAWEQRLNLDSSVLKHQARLARLVRNYVSGESLSETFSESELTRAKKLAAVGMSEDTGRLYAVRSTTIY